MKKIEINNNLLIKYCFSGRKIDCEDSIESYYTSIIQSLLDKNIIQDVQVHFHENPFDYNKDESYFSIEPIEKYVCSFSCNEKRNGEIFTFHFSIEFQSETHNDSQIMYVGILSNNYTFSLNSESNCLEILKHQLRKSIKDWENRYCLVDEQSEYYSVQLYPQIYEVENTARYYINDVFVKIFGANWWNEAIAYSLRKSRKERIEDTREYSGAYRDIEPYLMSLELNDLVSIAKTKKVKWIPTYDSEIEKILNKVSKADINSLLMMQCQTQIDIWEICFKKFLPDDFEDLYHKFEKRRNQIAHNKLMSFDTYETTKSLCEQLKIILTEAHKKFCNEFVSEEEKDALEEYMLDLEQQKELEIQALQDVAESESGVKVYSSFEIEEMFDEVLSNLHTEICEIFDERYDIFFSKYDSVNSKEGNKVVFSILSNITGEKIYFNADMDINDGQGETSELIINATINEQSKNFSIHFTNGEYSFNSYQSCYMPETCDSLDFDELEQAKIQICEFIEQHFKNLKEEADIRSHLAAMGEISPVVENDVSCCDCDEEYICIDEEIAPIGTCLNCGTSNSIIYCTHCGCPIEAIPPEYFDDEQIYYCDYCNDKLFGED